MAAQYGSYSVALAGVAATTGGAIFSILNPEGQALVITRATVYVSTVSAGAASLNMGVGSGATTDYDNLIDGLDVNAATGSFDNMATNGQAGTNGKSTKVWASGSYLTGTGSATTVGLVGRLFIEYYRTAAEA